MERLHCICGCKNFAALAFQIELEQLGKFLIIVHYQDLWFHALRLPSAHGVRETVA